MPGVSSTNLLTLSNTQAKELAGSMLSIAGERFVFKKFDPAQPGQPPWRSGAEGKAFPLLGPMGTVAAYLKFFSRPTPRRLDRTAWLIGQRMHQWLPQLAAAPLLWADTRETRLPTEIDFEFSGYLARAVPGKTWLDLKNAVNDGTATFSPAMRWRCVQDLLVALATLEQVDIAHGDLSPNNIVIDLDAPPAAPALYLIDFDAFMAPAAGENRAIAMLEGGTYGTDGYCPPDLAARAAAGDVSAAPYSDRYGRDMLLLELLLVERGMEADDPPLMWNGDWLARRLAQWRDETPPDDAAALAHLDYPAILTLPERARPSSVELATRLQLALPGKAELCPVDRLWHATPAIPGHRPAMMHVRRVTRGMPLAPPSAGRQATPALLQSLNPRRLRRPTVEPSIWSDIAVALGCLFPVTFPLLIAVVVLLIQWIVGLTGH